jgi:hypothetical protein
MNQISMPERLRSIDALHAVFSAAIIQRSATIALLVGTVLNAIDQGDVMLRGREIDWLKAAMNYVVPFCVASFGAYCACRERPRR